MLNGKIYAGVVADGTRTTSPAKIAYRSFDMPLPTDEKLLALS